MPLCVGYHREGFVAAFVGACIGYNNEVQCYGQRVGRMLENIVQKGTLTLRIGMHIHVCPQPTGSSNRLVSYQACLDPNTGSSERETEMPTEEMISDISGTGGT